MLIKNLRKQLIRRLLRYSSSHQWHSKDSILAMSTIRRNQFIKNGFLPSSNLVYNFEKYKMTDYLNHRDYRKLHPINGAMSVLIDNKAFLPILFQNNLDLMPEFFLHIQKGEIIYQRPGAIQHQELELLLKNSLDKYGDLIVKPVSQYGGFNIFKIDANNLKSSITKLRDGHFVINNCLTNDSFLSNIYPNSLNTIRVVFFKNKEKVNKILMIAQRFGNSQTKGVDNVSSGGLACSVNIISGELSSAYSYVSDSFKGWFTHHMDTGAQIEGAYIPDWSNKILQIEEIIKSLDFIEYGGVDLAFTNLGIKVIEINSLPQAKLTQVGGPALINQEFKEFIYSKGYSPKMPITQFHP